MTTYSSEMSTEPELDVNAIVAALRALHIRSPLDTKAEIALNTVLNNHATGGRKLILAILGPSGVGKTKTTKKLFSNEKLNERSFRLLPPRRPR